MDKKAELQVRITHNHAHHPPKNQVTVSAHELVREITADCASELLDICPVGRELSIALTKLEEVMFWANAAIARDEANQ